MIHRERWMARCFREDCRRRTPRMGDYFEKQRAPPIRGEMMGDHRYECLLIVGAEMGEWAALVDEGEPPVIDLAVTHIFLAVPSADS